MKGPDAQKIAVQKIASPNIMIKSLKVAQFTNIVYSVLADK